MDGIICVNKPQDFTSFDVVAKCRGILRERRIGHGGTLDPMATGVLPLFLGRATPAVDLIPDGVKSYHAVMRLGTVTDTYDITGKTVGGGDPSGIAFKDVTAAAGAFIGEIEQIPPMFSAVKINGERLYDAARSGREIERPSRRVTVESIEVADAGGGEYSLDIVCSKGTYVRSIVHDIGQALGCGAVLSALVRTRSCGFTLADCVTLEQLQQCRNEGDEGRFLRPVSEVFKDLPQLDFHGEELKKYLNGLAVSASGIANGLVAVNSGRVFLGIAEMRDGACCPKKLFAELEQAKTLIG